MRTKDRTPLEVAHIVDVLCQDLIARHGICSAVDIAHDLSKRMDTELYTQQTRHPADWPTPTVQPIQPEPKKAPPMPKVAG
jgi:hypothetical protein